MQRPGEPRFASVQEMLPLEDVVDGVLCLRGGDFRAVLEAQSVNFALKSDSEKEAIMVGYRAFLNALSYPIQVVVRILSTDVEPYLAALRGQAISRGAETLRRLADRPVGQTQADGRGHELAHGEPGESLVLNDQVGGYLVPVHRRRRSPSRSGSCRR